MWRLALTLGFSVFSLFGYSYTEGNKPDQHFVLEESSYFSKLADLRDEFGKNKTIPEKFELACLVALSYYPELKDVPIAFVFRKHGDYTMATKPGLNVLGQHFHHEYEIYICDDIKQSMVLLGDVHFNAQIGVIGHELAHVSYYQQNNGLRLIRDEVLYAISRKFRCEFERSTDKRTIDRGLGWQLYDFTSTKVRKPHSIDKYQEYKSDMYMTPEDILNYMKNNLQAYQ